MMKIKKEQKSIFIKTLMCLAVICLAIIASPIGQNFFVNLVEAKLLHRALRATEEWKDRIMHCGIIGIATIMVIYFLMFIKSGKKIAANIREDFTVFFKTISSKKGCIYFLFAFALFAFGYFKILQADFLYSDDVWRAYTGDRGWLANSRFISEFFSIITHNSFKLSDIGPLTQFISITMMSFASLVFIWILCNGKITFRSIIAASPIFLSPFFAECFAYRFDSPYMTLAVLLPILPFMFMKDKATFVFASVIFLILDCMSYQAGTSIYIVLAMYYALILWCENKPAKEVATFTGLSILSFILAMLLFRLCFMNKLFISDDKYFSATISIASIPSNVITYFKNITHLFGGVWIKLFFILCTATAYISFIVQSKRNKILSFVVTGLVFIGAAILSFGIFLCFDKPPYSARSFMGFNVFVAIICLVCAQGIVTVSKKRIVQTVAVCSMVYGCVVFMFAYGNVLITQKDYQKFRAEMLLTDLNEYASSESKVSITFAGTIGVSDKSKISRTNYPLISSMISVIPAAGNIWNDTFLASYNFDCVYDSSYSQKNDLPLLKDSYYHTIYGSVNKFFIVLKNPKS